MGDDDLHWIDGLYVGQLSRDELDLFERAVAAGRARRSYEGAMGFMGCAKVRVQPEARP